VPDEAVSHTESLGRWCRSLVAAGEFSAKGIIGHGWGEAGSPTVRTVPRLGRDVGQTAMTRKGPASYEVDTCRFSWGPGECAKGSGNLGRKLKALLTANAFLMEFTATIGGKKCRG
jgi:hypothetical protein